MKRFMKRLHKGEKGFTLIELLVVIAILGVLAAVAIPNVAGFIGSGAEEAKKTELANVHVAVTAALVEADVPGVLDVDYDPEAPLIVSAAVGAGDPATYLINDTAYNYLILIDGTTTQGDKVS